MEHTPPVSTAPAPAKPACVLSHQARRMPPPSRAPCRETGRGAPARPGSTPQRSRTPAPRTCTGSQRKKNTARQAPLWQTSSAGHVRRLQIGGAKCLPRELEGRAQGPRRRGRDFAFSFTGPPRPVHARTFCYSAPRASDMTGVSGAAGASALAASAAGMSAGGAG